MYDFRVLYETPCKRYRRIYYAFRSPPTVADRDFYLEEHMRRDFPEPGIPCRVRNFPVSRFDNPSFIAFSYKEILRLNRNKSDENL